MTNTVDPDQLASDLHCLQRQGISGFSRTRLKICTFLMNKIYSNCPKIWYINFSNKMACAKSANFDQNERGT